MLTRLYIKNYALIDNLDIAFDKGLNIITGETGAGKSIIMGALGLILGNRVEGKPFFDEQQKCVIEGYFEIASYGLEQFFQDADLDYESHTIIRREISLDGKSRAFVNDSPVNLTILKTLAEKLIDIHSQHATLQINTEEFQLFVLDIVAGNMNLLTSYKKEYQLLRRREQQLELLKKEIDAANAELDYNQFLFDELEKVDVREGEMLQLEEEQQQLENAEEMKKALLIAQTLLSDGDQNVQQALKEVLGQLQSVSKYFPVIAELTQRLESAQIEIKDIAAEISTADSAVNLDEKRLDDINTRVSTIYTLLKKHRLQSDAELISLKMQLEDKLEIASGQDDKLRALEKEIEVQFEKVYDLAQQLSLARSKGLVVIQKQVNTTLASVGMPNALLEIDMQQMEKTKVASKGLDRVQYLFSANKGQTVQPIQKVASGGELSRVMLAIKSLVAQHSALPTLIFDEIDTGISGEVALRVGEVMEKLAEHMQVLAITHLPQIASKGKSHFKVYKIDRAEKTISNIQLLDTKNRIVEIAQMLSGAEPGAAALQHAKELLN